MTSAQDILALNDPENLINIVHEQGRAIAELQQRFLELGALEEITRNLGSGVEAESLTVGEVLTSASAVQVDQWEALGLPSDSTTEGVWAIAYDEAHNWIIVGGDFSVLGGVDASNIIKFDLATRQWSSIGGGITGTVRAIIVDGDKIYVGCQGYGSVSGRLSVYTISTGTWATIIETSIYGMVRVGEDSLYVVGSFSTLGLVTAKKVAKYTISTGVWVGMGDTGMYEIQTIINVGDYLYIGGHHGTLSYGVLQYQISTEIWSSIDPDEWISAGQVRAILNVGDYLYVGGDLSTLGYITRYELSTGIWSSIGGGLNSVVWALGALDNKLFVCGQYTNANGILGANRLAVYNMDTAEWEASGNFDATITAICTIGTDVVVGGVYDYINGIPTRMIAMLHNRLGTVLGSYNAKIVRLQDDVLEITPPATTAANDFQVGSGAGAWIKKTLAEIKAILGLGTAAYTAATDYAVAAKGVTNGDSHNHSGGDGADITPAAIGAPDTSISTSTLADDTVYSFTPRSTTGIIIFTATSGSAQVGSENLIGYYNTNTPFIGTMIAGGSVIIGTGALTNGTTNGTDGKANVFVHTDDKIYIKNRMGANRNYRVQIFTL
jgi:hypothetical protein